MRVLGFIWLDEFVNKLAAKHGVATDEVEQIFHNRPFVTRIARGEVQGEDLYRALGQTDGGRYLAVFFVHKKTGRALVISARDMGPAERRAYVR